MNQVEINFCRFTVKGMSDVALPTYETSQSAGMDIRAAVVEPLSIGPGDIVLIPTGLGVALPDGYELQVRPRSGLAVKHGVTVVNSPGTIDADYRGEIKIALINLGKKNFTVQRGDRVAQLVLARVNRAVMVEVDGLSVTDRGTGGFGHTGLK